MCHIHILPAIGRMESKKKRPRVDQALAKELVFPRFRFPYLPFANFPFFSFNVEMFVNKQLPTNQPGWKPQILAERDARGHPQFEKYFNHFKALPSVNPNDYEVSCYIRWLALQQAGGGT